MDLPYKIDALEPNISRRTMEVHYEKHYKKYVSTLNKLVIGLPLKNMTIEEVILETCREENAIFQNAAQAWNHAFFWNCISPEKPTPSQSMLKIIDDQFNSLKEFNDKFLSAAIGLFGAGWVWLVKESDGSLLIEALENAGNPLTRGQVPLLVCDVWEHAYYLDYQSDRAEYLKRFLNIVNWKFVEKNFTQEPPHFISGHLTAGDLTTTKEFDRARGSHHLIGKNIYQQVAFHDSN